MIVPVLEPWYCTHFESWGFTSKITTQIFFFPSPFHLFEETSLKIKFRLKIVVLEFHSSDQ